MAFGKDQDPDIGKNTRFPYQQVSKKVGRKPSLKKDLERLLDNDGKLLIEASKIAEVNDDGSIIVDLPKREALMLHLLRIASGKSLNSLRAIQLVLETLEGKPTQLLEFREYENAPTIFVDATGHLEDLEEINLN